MTSRIHRLVASDRLRLRELPKNAADRLDALAPPVRDAIGAGIEFILSQQIEDGTWTGKTSPDIRTTAEYVTMCAWFGEDKTKGAQGSFHWLRNAVQNAETQAKLDVSTLLLVRLAFQLYGEAERSVLCRKLDSLVQLRGSLRPADNVARIYLAMFNQLSFSECDPLPPELGLLPSWAPLSLASQDRWSRAIRVPLTILSALRPQRSSIARISPITSGGRRPPARMGPHSGMTLPQRICYSAVCGCASLGLNQLRKTALGHARHWIVTRLSAASGVAGSVSATALSAIALNCLGCQRSSPAISNCFAALDRCRLPEGGVAARFVPNLETALAISTLAETGIATSEPDVNRAVEAILDREVARRGDWSESVDAEPGGWSAELDNERYPDISCTAATLVAMRAHFAASPASSLVTDDSMVAMIRANSLNQARQRIAVLDRVAAASRRARRWLAAMQQANGSWRTSRANWYATTQCDRRHLSAATTGVVLQALGRWEMRSGQAAVDRAATYLRELQTSNGLWPGGGILDYYATWMAIEGLLAVGVGLQDPAIRKAQTALLALQNHDGGFIGEGVTNSSALSTSWAMLALLSAAQTGDQELSRVVIDKAAGWLLNRQQPAGDWRLETASLGPQAVPDTTVSIYALLAVTRWAFAHRA